MDTTTLTSRSIATAGALVAAALLAVFGVFRLLHEPSGESTTVGTAEHAAATAFAALLLAQVPAVLRLGRLGGRLPAAIASGGMVVLALLATVSNVRGEDPSFFAAVAIPTNLAWFGGLIALAVVLRRRRAVPGVVAMALPLTYVCTIPFSMLGFGLVAAVLWLIIVRLALTPAPAPARRLQAA